MKRKLIQFTPIVALTLVATLTMAQTTITGVVADAKGQKPLQQANVTTGDGQTGTITRVNGHYSLHIKDQCNTIRYSMMGYNPVEIQTQSVPDTLFMTPLTIGLKEVNIIAAVTSDETSPVVSTTLNRKTMEQLSPGKAFPEVMRQIPGVYATRTGGGFGDAKLNIRGFSQENITILLNGVPVNSVENGLVYWNNWEGLTEATTSLQVQKGIGASMVAVNSAGGTINLITKTTEAEAGGSLSTIYTSYGNSRLMLNLSTGLTPSGWALSFTGSRSTGPGYIDATKVDGWSYLISAGKDFGPRHKLVLTLMGSPERHGQRNFELTAQEIKTHGLRYNKDWGSRDGQTNNLSENFYHKPYFTANHYFDVNERLFIASSVYATIGNGGGKSFENFNGNFIPQFQTASGQIDWDAVISNNQHNDFYVSNTGDTLRNFCKNVQTNFNANHYWMGLLSSARYQINNNLTMTGGIHGRYFRSQLYEEISDLLGGDYFIDDYAWAVEGASGREIKKQTGDIIRVDNGATVGLASAFGQLVYQNRLIDAFISGGISQTTYGRFDHYHYTTNQSAPSINKTGCDIKGGISIAISHQQRVFLNGGFFSRAPYHKFIYPNWNNVPATNIRNEKLSTTELGYSSNTNRFSVRVNGYLTLWHNKSILSKEYQLLENSSRTRALVNGLDALHKGVEAEIKWRPDERFMITASGSFGDWQWKNNVEALLYNQSNQVVDTVAVYADGLKVGDAPQCQVAFGITTKVLQTISFNATWNWYGQLYAEFDPSMRTDPSDVAQSWKLPNYNTLDVSLYHQTELAGHSIQLNIHCNNVLNQSYIIRGTDGLNHDADTFTGFWGYGRNFAFGAQITL